MLNIQIDEAINGYVVSITQLKEQVYYKEVCETFEDALETADSFIERVRLEFWKERGFNEKFDAERN